MTRPASRFCDEKLSSFRTWALNFIVCIAVCTHLACHHGLPLKPYIAYVVNEQSATLAAVNLASFRVVATLPVAPQPERVLQRPKTQQLYVVSASGKITVADFPQLRVVTTLDVGKSAKDLAFSNDGHSAFVLDPAGHEVVFINCGDAAAKSPEDATPSVAFRLHLDDVLADLSLSPDGKILVASSSSPSQLTFISTEQRTNLGSAAVGESAGPLVILPDSSKVFVADTGEEKISAADIATRTLLLNIEIGNRPNVLLLKPDGGELFVLAANSSTMVIADAFHDNVEQTFPVGRNPVAGIFNRNTTVLYIANAGDGSVLALDVTSREVLASTHIGMEPRALALTPDERLLVVADTAASSLAIIQADAINPNNDRSALLTSVTVGSRPVDVVVPKIEGLKQ